MSEPDPALVYTGFWINYAQGSVLGATITIHQEWTNVIVAFLAIVVTLGAGSAWNLLLFATHQLRATSEARDVLWRQQQVLLRSLATPGSVMVDSLKLLNIWKRRGPYNRARCALPALVALLFSLATLAAGIFSAYIVDTGTLQVLLRDAGCRNIELIPHESLEALNERVSILNAIGNSAQSYATECYGNDTVPSKCHQYVQPRIEGNVTSAKCPFDPPLCDNSVEHGVRLDSGYIDSNDDLGINAPLGERVRVRRTNTCAPLKTDGHLRLVNLSQAPDPGTVGSQPGLYYILDYGTSDPPVSKTINATAYRAKMKLDDQYSYSQRYAKT